MKEHSVVIAADKVQDFKKTVLGLKIQMWSGWFDPSGDYRVTVLANKTMMQKISGFIK